MRMLKMNGYPITNIQDYNQHFNLYDILKQRKAFLIFVLSHFANLSKTNLYCASMAYIAIENHLPVFMDSNIYDKKSKVEIEICDTKNFWENPFGFCQSCTPPHELLNSTFAISNQFALRLNEEIFKKIMLITIVAYTFLSNKSLDVLIDLDKVKNAFLGNEKNLNRNSFELCFEENTSDIIQTICLEPSSQVYTCLPYDNSEFKSIKTFRISASKKINSLSNRTVKISIGDRLIIVPAGEHIYVNTVNGYLVNVLDKEKSKKEHVLKNPCDGKDELLLDSIEKKLDFYGNEYISSFDFISYDNSIVYINNLKLKLDLCSSVVLAEKLSEYSEMDIVEVKLENNSFYLLKANGELISDDYRCNGELNVYSIDEVLRRCQ